MARSIILAASALSGLWTLSDGRQERRPCPPLSAYADGGPVRVPEGCTAERAGVWVAPARYVEGAGELAALRAEVEGLKRERDEARAARRELSEQLNDTLAAQVERLKLIEALCAPRAPEPCPVWTPRAEGALVGGLVCGALYLGDKIR